MQVARGRGVWIFIRIIFALVLAPSVVSWSALSRALASDDSCITMFLDGLLEDYSSDSDVYVCSMCYVNSGELARRARAAYGAPLDFEKLHILILHHREMRSITESDPNIDHALQGMGSRSGRPHLWRYHAVLEYQGLIIDLDLGGARRAISAHQYFQTMFPESTSNLTIDLSLNSANQVRRPRVHNRREDIRVISLPASEYLRHFPQERPRMIKAHLDQMAERPGVTLDEFLQGLSGVQEH